jgi:Tfp pilus assembly protein PilF
LNRPANDVPAAASAELSALYEPGRYLAAYNLAVEHHGPLADWPGGTAALVFGSRLAGNLGGNRLSQALVLRARRRAALDPATTDAERANAALFHAFRTFGRRGPFALRRFLQRPGVRGAFEADGTATLRADVLCLHAHVAAAFRDTDAVEAAWQQAHALAEHRPWIWTERAALLVLADRYAEALAAAQVALGLHAWYRPAVQQAAHVLTLLGRDDEAVALLDAALDPSQGGGGLESSAVAAQLAELCAALRRPDEVLRALDRFEAFSPLLEAQGRLWLTSRRSEARLQLGDLAGAADTSEPLVAASIFYEKTVPRLRDPERQAQRRLVHAVPFVRQHERTCAPATLAALSRFWQRPANQAEITREICYGGTFDHQERHWAETHGWAVREFRADWLASVALLDAGIPFALVTNAINSGHLQAVIAYDARRGTIVIRDPFDRSEAEFLGDEFFGRYAYWGPRAMALVPADDLAAAARLRAIDLPEAALFDGLYRLRRALHRHDRAAARAALDDLERLDPAARLTFFAQRELASYDGDNPAALAAVEGLLTRFPNEVRLRLEKLTLLRGLARPVEARAWLETCAADRQHAEPNLWRELARDLAGDARERSRARQLLWRSLFYEPTEAEHLRLFAELLWAQRDYPEAAALFRLAATSAGTRENHWQQLFIASRYLHETGDTLRLLEARFRRLGDQSSQPARTLYWAYRERHQITEAAAVLEQALARRPGDGELLLFAATARARDGEHAEAARLLGQAQGQAPPGMFSRTAAELASLAGDSTAALAHWRKVLAREPLDPAAHQAVARLLTETDPRGPAAAREHLAAAVARFPHAVALLEMRINALVDAPGRGTPEHAAAVAALLAVQPANVWALRENVLSQEARGDVAAALDLLDTAEQVDPLAPPTHALRGRLLRTAGDLAGARASLRRALDLDADLPGVLAMLLECSPTAAEKREALDFMHGLLVRPGFVGDGILAYRAAAYPILEDAELQSQLDAVLAARPDLCQAWSAVVRQHADGARLADAQAKAQAAAARFPLLPSVWLDLALVERMRGDSAAELAALERAGRLALLSRQSAAPLGYLALARLRRHDRAGARTALRQAMQIDVAYHYAPATLFDLEIEDKEFRAAAQTLLFLQKHHAGPATLARTILLAARRKDEPPARAALAELARTRPEPGSEEGDFQAAVNAMIDAGWRAAAESALRQAMSTPDTANPECGAIWVRSRAERGKWWDLGQAVRRLPEGDLGRRAQMAYLTVLTKRSKRLRLLVFVWRMRRPLRADTERWAKAGYALTGCDWHRLAVRWFSDWAGRPAVGSWMLFNFATSWRALGRYSDAVEIDRRALTLPRDQTRPKHAAWVALEDALTAGDEARHRTAGLHAELAPQLESLDQPHRYLVVLTGQILTVRALAAAGERRTAYRAALETLRRERARCPQRSTRAVCHAERRARRRLAKDAGGWVRGLVALVLPVPLPVFGGGTLLVLAILIRVLFGLLLTWLTH